MVRRLIRLVVLGCCLVSLAACIGGTWFWWRSYRTIDRVIWDRGGRHGQFSSVRGRLSLIVLPDHSTGPAPPSWRSESLASSKPAPLEPDAYWTEGTLRFWISKESLDRRIGPVQLSGGRMAVLDNMPAARFSRAPVTAGTLPAQTPRPGTFPPAGQTPLATKLPTRPQPDTGAVARTAASMPPVTTTSSSPSTVPAKAFAASGEAGNAPAKLPNPFGGSVDDAHADPPSETVNLYPDEFKLFRPLPKRTEQPTATGYGLANATPRVGYVFGLALRTPTYVFDRWTAPYWPLVCAAALPPLLWSAARARRILIRRRCVRRGMCLACGYDLTHNLSGVCPECGTKSGKVE